MKRNITWNGRTQSLGEALCVVPRFAFAASRDKMRRMKSSKSGRKTKRKTLEPDSDREEWRLPLTEEEADKLNADSLDLALNHNKTKAGYMRQILLCPLDSSQPVPVFESIEVPIDRPVKARVRLSDAELLQIENTANRLGIDAKRYARWRLLGVLN